MTMASDIHQAWRGLPVGSLDEVIGSGTCLILAPHPDDESLGCGGLIATCVAADRAPLVAVLTDGAGSHPGSAEFPPDRLLAVRKREVLQAVACLGLPPNRVVFMGEPDTAAPRHGPGFDRIVRQLVRLIRCEPGCSAILASWRHDPHCDHEAASLAAAAAAGITQVRHVAFPVWGWTLLSDAPVAARDAAGYRLDISAFRSRKQQAIRAHKTQYGGLITDDPTGFRLPPGLLSVFDSPFETFLHT
jgi:LmbE family N-acetylglucosaminyl deacetylase